MLFLWGKSSHCSLLSWFCWFAIIGFLLLHLSATYLALEWKSHKHVRFVIPGMPNFIGTPPLNHKVRYNNYWKYCKIVPGIYCLDLACEHQPLAVQLQRQLFWFTLAKELILHVPFASCHGKMKCRYHLHSPTPTISEVYSDEENKGCV